LLCLKEVLGLVDIGAVLMPYEEGAFSSISGVLQVGYLHCKEVESEYLHEPRVHCKVEGNQLSEDRLYRQEDRTSEVSHVPATAVLDLEQINSHSGSDKLNDERDSPHSRYYSKLPDIAVVLLFLIGMASVPEVDHSLVHVEHGHHSQTEDALFNRE